MLIQRLQRRHLEPLYELESDSDVKRYVGGPVRRPRDEWLHRAQEMLGAESCPLAILLGQDESFVGRASLDKIGFAPSPPDRVRDRECELEILIARNYWGGGLGYDTANALIRAGFASDCVASIVAVVDPDNAASLNLVIRLGFEFVGLKDSPDRWDHQHKRFRLEWACFVGHTVAPVHSKHS